jgi:hypothetical protein
VAHSEAWSGPWGNATSPSVPSVLLRASLDRPRERLMEPFEDPWELAAILRARPPVRPSLPAQLGAGVGPRAPGAGGDAGRLRGRLCGVKQRSSGAATGSNLSLSLDRANRMPGQLRSVALPDHANFARLMRLCLLVRANLPPGSCESARGRHGCQKADAEGCRSDHWTFLKTTGRRLCGRKPRCAHWPRR